jgi:periplasmic divalent cation tolerance protein
MDGKAADFSALLVVTNLPDRASAEKLADSLVERQLAACVNVLAPCRSVYRWQGALERAEEHPVLIKTTPECYAAVERAIVESHPYELPEVIAVPIVRGLPAYLDWVAAQSKT